MSYSTPVDIANRALQHVGAPRITTFTDNAKTAAEVSFCYDKLRRAELRRTVWRFAIRRAVLRALTATTKRIIPLLWNVNNLPGTFAVGSIVMDSVGVYWICMVAHTPSILNAPGVVLIGQPQYWQQYFGPLVADAYDATVSYYAGEMVYVTDTFYTSLANGNLNNDPASHDTVWTAQTGTTSQPIYPMIAAGPGVTVNNLARNLFMLPNGYLRVTYPDPKTPSTAANVVSAGLRFSDWQFEGNYIVSASAGPLFIRFVADISDVAAMDDLFCEGLAARIGYEICEIITQSPQKLQATAAAYNKFIGDARLIDWIETASSEPQEEDYELTTGPASANEGMPRQPAPQGGQNG